MHFPSPFPAFCKWGGDKGEGQPLHPCPACILPEYPYNVFGLLFELISVLGWKPPRTVSILVTLRVSTNELGSSLQTKGKFFYMNNQSKSASAVQFFTATIFLFLGLTHFQSAQSYNGLENNFMADNWGLPLAFLLTILFASGWWFVSAIENLVLSKGKNAAIFPLVAIFLVFVSTLISSFLFTDPGFLFYAILSSGYFLMCGFFFRFLVVRPEVIAKYNNGDNWEYTLILPMKVMSEEHMVLRRQEDSSRTNHPTNTPNR